MKLKLQHTYFKQSEESGGCREVIIGREVLGVLEGMNRNKTPRVNMVLNKCRKVKKDADS